MSPTKKGKNNKAKDDGETSGSDQESGSGRSSRVSSPAPTSNTIRSRSGTRSRSGSRSASRSRSRSSGSAASDSGGSVHSRSRSRSKSKSKSRSKSPTTSVKSRSRSKSKSISKSRSRSKSASRSKSRSRSKSASRSKSRSRSKSKSRSRSGSKSDSKSRSRSRSASVASNKSSSHESDKSNSSPHSRKSKSKSPTVLAKEPSAKIISDGSGSDEDVIKPKKLSEPSADATQLFGDADDISSGSSDSENEGKTKKVSKSPEDGEKKGTEEPMEVEENDRADKDSDAGSVAAGSDQEVEEPPPETRIDVEIPKITTDLGKGIHFVKLPNFLSVETRPFDPNTYEDEIDDEETLDEEGRARLKLKVENTIRWRERFNEKNVFVKESNARFVRWSDGSLSLHLGSEIFNVYKQPLQGDHNHLFIRQGTGLQGQAVFRTKLTFRPHSTESFTHRKMTLSLADRSQKTSGIKILSQVGKDPEAHRDEMIKKEEDKLRASVRRENKQRRVRERVTSRSGGGLTASYLEADLDDDDDNAISLSAIKNRYKKGGTGKSGKLRTNIYSSEEDDEPMEEDVSDGDEGLKARKLEKAKRLLDSDEEDEEEGNDGGAKGGSNEHSEEEAKAPSNKADDSE